METNKSHSDHLDTFKTYTNNFKAIDHYSIWEMERY